MRVEDLIERAKKLKERGLTTGEIAAELNVSKETAMWLLAKARKDLVPPSDVYVDLRRIANPVRMRCIATILANMIKENIKDKPEVVVGVATSGIPIATMVAEELNAELSMYYPKKLKWEGDQLRIGGIFSENFAKVDGKKCVIVDNVITSGSTIKETAEQIKNREGEVLGAAVIIDKKGLDKIDDFPVLSIFRIVRL